MSAPTRYDLHPSSCVNKEVESFNRKLQKFMKIHNHIHVCSMSTNRDHFTTHGLHMNTQGKNWITHTWASHIKTLTPSSSLTPIPLPEKNKYNENPVSPADNSCVNNLRDCVHERPVLQNDRCNEAKNNEPAKDNLRSSRQKKPSDKNEIFYGIKASKKCSEFQIQ